MQRDIVRSVIAQQPDMEVVSEYPEPENFFRSPPSVMPDVIILGTGKDKVVERYRRVLLRNPELRIVEVDAEGRRLSVCQLKPHRVSLGELSPNELVAVIRTPAEYALE